MNLGITIDQAFGLYNLTISCSIGASMTRTVVNAPEGYEWIESAQNWHLGAGGLAITGRTSQDKTVEVVFDTEGKNVWRISLVPDGSNLPVLPMVISKAGAQIGLYITESAKEIVAEGSRLTLHILKNPWCISFSDENGKTIFRENPYDVDGINRLMSMPLGFVRDPSGKIKQVTESAYIAPDEHLFGLGEKFTSLDKKGQPCVLG